jgi:hypothetical protein
MSTHPDLDTEWQKRLNPSITREPMFWVGIVWSFIVLFSALIRSTSTTSYLAAFAACMFMIAAHEQLAKKRMKALIDWIESQKTRNEPRS